LAVGIKVELRAKDRLPFEALAFHREKSAATSELALPFRHSVETAKISGNLAKNLLEAPSQGRTTVNLAVEPQADAIAYAGAAMRGVALFMTGMEGHSGRFSAVDLTAILHKSTPKER